MSKQFTKNILASMQQQQLSDLAKSWNLKKPSPKQQQLVEQLYNHKNNQLRKRRSKRANVCQEMCKALCIKEDCHLHPETELNLDSSRLKSTPTRLLRAPLPVCWFVSSCQLLATIDWPSCFYKMLQESKNHILQESQNQ